MNIIILMLYISILCYASYTDIKYMIIKDRVHLFIILLALINFKFYLLEAIIITLPFLILAVITDKIGGGDIKFVFVNSLIISSFASYLSLLIGFTVALISSLIQIKMKKINEKNPFALAPYLSIGFAIGYVLEKILQRF